jgi:hypothetical protein
MGIFLSELMKEAKKDVDATKHFWIIVAQIQ